MRKKVVDCVHKIGGCENEHSISADTSAEKFAFAITKDGDGEEHLGIKMDYEFMNKLIENLQYFYRKGMIPWVCPSCGRFFGANYDVGSIRWFECGSCGAEWELYNETDVDEFVDREKLKLKGAEEKWITKTLKK